MIQKMFDLLNLVLTTFTQQIPMSKIFILNVDSLNYVIPLTIYMFEHNH